VDWFRLEDSHGGAARLAGHAADVFDVGCLIIDDYRYRGFKTEARVGFFILMG
jgi:hypothetical protein